jgi:hypothetical protein
MGQPVSKLSSNYQSNFAFKENDAKRARALKKAEDERDLQRSKQKEIERLQEEIKQVFTSKEKFARKVAKYAKFNTYLEKVIVN